jgi:Na+-driven multidrug efflux pump
LFPESLIRFWAPNDPAVVRVGAPSLRLLATSLPLMVVGLILSHALYGAGANAFVMFVEVALLVVLVPTSWLLGSILGLGLEGVWIALTLFVDLLGLAMAAKFLTRSWQRIRL